MAFYNALETNDNAVRVLGDETLRGIARDHSDPPPIAAGTTEIVTLGCSACLGQ